MLMSHYDKIGPTDISCRWPAALSIVVWLSVTTACVSQSARRFTLKQYLSGAWWLDSETCRPFVAGGLLFFGFHGCCIRIDPFVE